MMNDTAQPMAAETDPIAEAASAFKAFTTGEPVVRPRDDQGRFAPAEPEVTTEAAQPLEAEPAEETEDAQEAADEAQPLPPSWPEDQADYWNQLPPETREFILNREGERERAVQAKFQESANARKEAQAEREAAKATRSELLNNLEVIETAIQPAKPDPRAFGYGTEQFNRPAYDMAVAEYEQQAQTLEAVRQQRQQLAAQQAEAERADFLAWKQEHEAEYAPKLLADLPELTDPAKGEPVLRELVDYAIKAGIPANVFSEAEQEAITSAQLHILWKAQQFDKLKAGAPQPKPKPASPAVRPGVSSPRSAQKSAQRAQVFDRLAREGSIEAGAAMFKTFLSGR